MTGVRRLYQSISHLEILITRLQGEFFFQIHEIFSSCLTTSAETVTLVFSLGFYLCLEKAIQRPKQNSPGSRRDKGQCYNRPLNL